MIKIIKNFNLLLDKHQKRKLIILAVITVGGAFLEVLGVSLMIPMVTAIMQPDIIATNSIIKRICEIFGLQSHRSFVLLCIISLIVIFAVKNLYLLFEYYVQANFVYSNRFQTQKEILHAYMCRPYEFYLGASSSEIMRGINNDVNDSYELLMTLLFFFTESVVSIALIITIFVVDPLMTTCIAVMMGLIVLAITKKLKPILAKKGDESRKYSAESFRWVLQAVEGIKEIKVTHKETFFESHFSDSGEKIISAAKSQYVFKSTPRLLIEAGSVCATLAVIAVMIYAGKPLEDLIPSLAAFAMAAVKLMPSANRIVNAMSDIAYHGPSLENLLSNLTDSNNCQNQIIDVKHTLTIDDKIELKNIVYCYPNSNINVLDGANMVIPAGSTVGIVGKSGAGKTTAVDILLGLLSLKSGTVTTDGVDIMNNYVDWLNHIGYIPQSIFLLNDSIKANVAFGNIPDDKAVWDALDAAQLGDFIRTLPQGLDTNIGERGIRLSGGQRQRLGIARALYTNPELLIFDEATSSLDSETESAVMESINGLRGMKTMIIIAHRIQTIKDCDLIYKVQNGKIVKEQNIN